MLCIFNICCKTWNNIKVDLMYPNVFVNKKKIYTVDAKNGRIQCNHVTKTINNKLWVVRLLYGICVQSGGFV